MKLSLHHKGIVLGSVSALAALGVACAAGAMFRPAAGIALTPPPAGTPEFQGYTLYMRNCARCHGDDARGGDGPDDGPDLHDVAKSDTRITSMIKNGIPDQMPKFGAKLTDADIRALIAFIRSLKD